MKIRNLSTEEVLNLIKDYKNIYQILKHLGVNASGSGAYKTFRHHCKELGVEIPKGESKGINRIGKKIPLSEILVENSTYQNNRTLKNRLVSEGYLKYECNNCKNLGEWCGRKLVLQIDHINGINNDHRIENLRFLCPNCHSQTKTYSGKNLKKK